MPACLCSARVVWRWTELLSHKLVANRVHCHIRIEAVGRMRVRVAKDLTTTFASHYSMRGSLEVRLTKDAVSVYNARRTAGKYLVVP